MSKPFNLADAKAGHPVRTGKYDVKIHDFAFEVRAIGPCLMGTIVHHNGGFPRVGYWSQDGKERCQSHPVAFDLVMAPIGAIDGKPVYPGDMITTGGHIQPAQFGLPFPTDAKWPRQYPMTQMVFNELADVYEGTRSTMDGYQAVANAAIRHGIDNGYLLDPRDNISIKLPEMSQEELERVISGDTGRASIIYDQGPITYGNLQKVATALGIHLGDSFEDVKDKIKRRERAILRAGIAYAWDEDKQPIHHVDRVVDALIAKVK